MYVNSSFSISFFPKPTLIRLFSSFSVETALDRSLVTSKYLNSQSILSSHCVWPINSIWHSWFLISPFFTFGFQNTTHFCPLPFIDQFLSVSFVVSSFLLFKIGVLIGDLMYIYTSFNTICMLAPKLISLRSLFCSSEPYIQLPAYLTTSPGCLIDIWNGKCLKPNPFSSLHNVFHS